MKILVLGADGYLGWPTCMHLASIGYDVIAVDNYMKRQIAEDTASSPLVEMPKLKDRSTIFQNVTGKTINTHEGDLSDYEFMSKVVEIHKPDTIIHYAEQPSGPYSMLGHKEGAMTLHNNVGTTFNLIMAVLEHCPEAHIVKLGTMGEYGTPNTDIPEGWFDFEIDGRKDRRLFPRQAGSFYHTTKILDTDILEFWVRNRGIKVTDLMQGPVYGMRTEHTALSDDLGTHFWYDDMFGTALNRFVVQAVHGMPLTVYGKGGQTRGYLDIRDTMQCITLATETPALQGQLRIMNQFTEDFSANKLAQIVHYAADSIGLAVTVDHIENPRIEEEDHYYNANADSFAELGLKPHLLTQETVVGMLEYVTRHKGNIDPSSIMPRVTWKGVKTG